MQGHSDLQARKLQGTTLVQGRVKQTTLHEMYNNKHGRDMQMNVLNVYKEKIAYDSNTKMTQSVIDAQLIQ